MKHIDTLFKPSRFMDLCKKEIMEEWKKNVMRIVMLYGLLTIAFVWNAVMEYRTGDANVRVFELVFGTWTFILGGMYCASLMSERLKSKTGRTAILTLPATSFEKYFVRWVVFTLCYIGIFFIGFFLADYLRLFVGKLFFPRLEGIEAIDLSTAFVNSRDDYALFNAVEPLRFSLVCYFLAQSFFVLGSMLWPQNSLLKTFAAIVVAGVIIGHLTAIIAHFMVPDTWYIQRGPHIDDAKILNVASVIGIAGTLFNWILAYFRFKEMEIINRW